MLEKVKIVYEDKWLMVVNKPSGMVTTKERKGEEGTLEDFLSGFKKNSLSRNGIVHRLDKGTSGLVLVAKNSQVLVDLKRQFKERKVEKKYWAMVLGEVVADGVIDRPIGRSKYGFGKFGIDVDGKRALTGFKLINKYRKGSSLCSLIEVNLKTGRTHQIRVHFSHLGWPLLGDKLYGGKDIGLDRPFLHCFYLKFWHPKLNKEVEFNLELADDLKLFLEGYEKV